MVADPPPVMWRPSNALRSLICLIAVPLAITASTAARPVQPREAQAPRRIVSLIPAVTEMLLAMDAASRIVGVGSFDRLPAAYDSIPRVGGLLDPDVERILALRPDLVIFYGTQSEVREQLARANIPIFPYEHAGLADITATIRTLGARIGRPADGERVAASVENAIARTKTRVAGRKRPRTMLVFGREPRTLRNIDVSGGIGFFHDMLEAAGATNAFADVPRQRLHATTEVIIARAPDVIVEIQVDEKMPEDRRSWTAISSVPAVRLGRIHVLRGQRFVLPGPGVAAAIEDLARVIHPIP